MIPTIDLSESETLAEELRQHHLYKRRADIEQQFLDELTKLTRKYGLAIKADTRTEYGETYPDCSLEKPYEGTEGRYVFGQWGIEFEPAKKGDLLPCSREERKEYEKAKAARAEEDKVIGELNRQISHAYSRAYEKGMQDMHAQMVQQHKASVVKLSVCSCGEHFASDKSLRRHAEDTGHRI